MVAPAQPARTYRFETFEFDPQTGELRRRGAKLRLYGQPLEILAMLLERPGEVVRREELRARLWSADRFVDFEHGLNAAVNKLREALGDSAEEPKFIETVPRRGYRFIAPIEAGANGGQAIPAVPTETQSSRRWIAIVTSAVVLLVGAGVVFVPHRGEPLLTRRDSILITGVANRTGDPVFDGTLQTALEVSLEQSPYLNVVPDRKVRETLLLMAKPPDTPLTDEIGREICQRDGIRAMLGGSIAALGSQYVITLRAVNAATGDTLAEELVQANSKEQVLSALGRAGTALRRKLGESLSSVRKFDTSLPKATTSSLDALKTYSLGLAQYAKDDAGSAIALFQHAIELDPNFAIAYVALGGARDRMGEVGRVEGAISKAYLLRNRATERERLDITSAYYQFATLQVDQAIQTCQLWKEIYPRDPVPYRRLGYEYATLGRWEDSAKEFGAAKRLDPSQYLPYAGLLEAYMALNRLPDALATYKQAQARQLGSGDLRRFRYRFAFLAGDTRTMAKVATSFAGQPAFEAMAAATEAYYGRLNKARQMWRHATETALRHQQKGPAASFDAEAALVEALFGNVETAHRDASAALRLFAGSRSWGQAEAVLALALVGDSARAGKLADGLARDHPVDTVLNNLWLPEIRSVIKLKEGKVASAVNELMPAATYERGWTSPVLMAAYLRGQAYLAERRGPEAAREFQRIVDNRGLVFNAPDGSLALLGLGRAYVLEAAMARGDQTASFRTKARTAYRDFLALWKDANPAIPAVQQAKTEYAKLQ